MGLHFQDVPVGTRWQTPCVCVYEEDIVRFAREWDPQPFHLDKVAAKASVFGGLCASGLQTLLLSYRLFLQLKLFEGTMMAGLGMEHLRFHVPVLAGETIYVRIVVEEAVVTSKPERGLLKLRLSTHNRADKLLADFLIPVLVKLKLRDA
ncbi:MaoC/PaaZ C-terminal domain-containing protein [Cupriavidus basilensis]